MGVFHRLAGANSVLFSKSLTYIITAPWPSQLSDWYCWAVLGAFIATGGYWVHRTAVALQKFPAGLVMSVMQVCSFMSMQCNRNTRDDVRE